MSSLSSGSSGVCWDLVGRGMESGDSSPSRVRRREDFALLFGTDGLCLLRSSCRRNSWMSSLSSGSFKICWDSADLEMVLLSQEADLCF